MVSLEVISLFMRIPTDETLTVVQDKLAADPSLEECTCIPIDNLLWRCEYNKDEDNILNTLNDMNYYYYYYYYCFMQVFHTITKWWLSLSDSKSFQLSKTFLSILVDLSSAVIWTVSILLQISSSPIFFQVFEDYFKGSKYDWY